MWDMQTREDVKSVAEQRLENIDDAVNLLTQMNDALTGLDKEQEPNPVRAFNDLYLTITKGVKEDLQLGTYRDAAFMEILDVEFVRLYSNALLDWSKDNIVPMAWAQLFALEDDGTRHNEFEGALLGVNAHVNRDLTYALINAGQRSGHLGNLEDRLVDFNQINDIFSVRLDPVVNELITKIPYTAWRIMWQVIDAICGNLDEYLMLEAIVQCRSRAWQRAANFWAVGGSVNMPEFSGRDQLSAFLGKMALNSHLFDGNFLPSCRTSSAHKQLKYSTHPAASISPLSDAGEILFGSDLLEVEFNDNRATVASRNRRINGSWEGDRNDLVTTFGADWMLEVIGAEAPDDIEVKRLQHGAEILGQQRNSPRAA